MHDNGKLRPGVAPAFVPNPAATFDLGSTFLLWGHPFIEGCVWVNKRYRTIDDADEALLYLAAWHFLMADISENADLLNSIGRLPFRTSWHKLSPLQFRATSITAFVEETGIPRETARRKLSSLVRRGLFVAQKDSLYRLSQISEDMLDLSIPAFSFARWIAVFHGWPASTLGRPRSIWTYGSLVRHYLSAYIALVKSKRIQTGGISHVPVQMSLMLIQVLKVARLLQLEGPPAEYDFKTWITLLGRLMDEPIYMRQLAYISEVPLAAVRSSCARLARVNGIVRVLNNDTLMVGGHSCSAENLGDGHFFTHEIEQRLTRFAAQTFARAKRLANNP